MDADGHFTGSGDQVAYVHQDLSLAMQGTFEKGLMIDGQETKIIGESCNHDGIKVLQFDVPRGPVYHYEEPTNVTFGDQPNLRDPLVDKLVI